MHIECTPIRQLSTITHLKRILHSSNVGFKLTVKYVMSTRLKLTSAK